MLTLLALGLGLGFLGILASLGTLFGEAPGRATAAAAGALLAGLPVPRLRLRAQVRISARGYLLACCAASAIALVMSPVLGTLTGPAGILFWVGVATGCAVRVAVSQLQSGTFPGRHLPMVSMVGIGLGTGAASAAGFAFLALLASKGQAIAWWAAIVPAVVAYVLALGRPSGLQAADSPASSASPSITVRGTVQSASLVLQAVAWLVMACGLPVYLARDGGVSGWAGAGVASVFWGAYALGWSRPRSAVRAIGLRGLAVALAGGVLGAVLVWTAWLPAAVCGAVLLGAGFGLLASLTLRLHRWPSGQMDGLGLRRSPQMVLPVALLAMESAALVDAGPVGPALAIVLATALFVLTAMAVGMLQVDRYLDGDPSLA